MIRGLSMIGAARVVRMAGVLLAAVVLVSCGQAILSAPNDSTMTIFVNPSFIAANGDVAVVSVLVIEPAGTPVPDGTVVQFFTTLGKIQEQAKTNDGVARVNLISDARSGEADITAVSGSSKTDKATVIIGTVRPERIFAALLDARIDLSQGQSIARFKVTVLDAKGNPVVGVRVRFSVVDNPAVDRIIEGPDSTTDNNGDAFNRVQTQRTTPGVIKIHAEVLSATAVAVDFTINVVE